jgi:hypothetical protein
MTDPNHHPDCPMGNDRIGYTEPCYCAELYAQDEQEGR